MSVLDQYFGPATWFLTLSCDEMRWEDMYDVLKLLNTDLDGLEKMKAAELAAKDPMTVAEHFLHRFRTFLNTVLRVRTI